MSLTLEQAKNLQPGQELWANFSFNKRGIPRKVKVNGKVRTWKRNPERVQIPYKYGLYEYGYITERDLPDFCLTPEEAIAEMKSAGLPEKKIYLDPNTGLTIRT